MIDESKNSESIRMKSCVPSLSVETSDLMKKDNQFTVYPTHSTPVGFWHDVCRGCSYEITFDGEQDDSKRVSECNNCMDNTLRYYQNKKAVPVSIDEKGRHIIKSYE
jgi:hypothetical protein